MKADRIVGISGLGLLIALHSAIAYGAGAVPSSPASSAGPTCVPLPVVDTGYKGPRGLVSALGIYCLSQDIVAVKVFDVHAGRFKSFASEGLISVSPAPDSSGSLSAGRNMYVIDLQGRRLSAEPNEMIGIENRMGGFGVTIRDGHIEVPGKTQFNQGISLLRSGAKPLRAGGQQCPLALPKCEDIPASKTDDGRRPEYAATNYLVEKLNIRAGWRGVQMGGGGNTLRDSVIEVDSRVAVFQFGPGAVIENNTFVVHGKGDRNQFDAALKLRDAHNAVVRNNTFIFKGGFFASAPAAINLLDSKDVLIEGNTFKGFDQKVRVGGDSTYSLK